MSLPTPYYADDLVTLYHGDCRELLPLVEADVVVTDPPYGIAWAVKGGTGRRSRDRTRVVRGFHYAPIRGDDEPFDPTPLLAMRLPTVLFGANHYASRLPNSATWFVWDKRVTDWTNDQSDAEMAWTNLSGPLRIYRQHWNGGGSLRAENGTEPLVGGVVALHPTQKPVDLMRWVLQRCPEGTVLDPYAGSGTTLVAAKSLNRRAIGIEIEERYCEVAANRLRQDVLGLSA